MGKLSILALTVVLAGCGAKRPVVLGERAPKGCTESSGADNEECAGFWLDKLMRMLAFRTYDNAEVSRYVASVGKRLALAAHDNRPWKFVVLDDPGVQAFVTMGSTVYIYRGTLAVLRSEAELAAVLAHEMGHLRGGHARDRWAEIGRDVVRTDLDRSLANRYARDDEIQADEHSVILLSRAGYDPRAVATMLEALGGTTYDSVSGDDPDDVHPWWPERIARAQALSAMRDARGDTKTDRYRRGLASLIVGDDPRRISLVNNVAVLATSHISIDLPAPGKLDDGTIELAFEGATAQIRIVTTEIAPMFTEDRSKTVGVEVYPTNTHMVLLIVKGIDAPARAKALLEAIRVPTINEIANLRPVLVDLDAPRRLWSR